ncbi:hypothetical protein [Leptospira sp. 'Mane']|uniref:hypothetical protein n=1 Tax=Leptospira sp. 'Mane' TaxID=3387407 RepID=UPI00398A6E1B
MELLSKLKRFSIIPLFFILGNCFTNPVFQDHAKSEEEKRKKAIAVTISLIGLSNFIRENTTPRNSETQTTSLNSAKP